MRYRSCHLRGRTSWSEYQPCSRRDQLRHEHTQIQQLRTFLSKICLWITLPRSSPSTAFGDMPPAGRAANRLRQQRSYKSANLASKYGAAL